MANESTHYNPDEEPQAVGDILSAMEIGVDTSDVERARAVAARALGHEISAAQEDRDELAALLEAGKDQPEVREALQETTILLLGAQAEHVKIDGTAGGNRSNE